MSDTPNVVFKLEFVQSDERLKNNKVLGSKFGEKRRFYSCKDGGDMDNLHYVDKGTREPQPIIEMDYVGYSGNNEKSSGVFNGKGMLSKRDCFELRKDLQTTKSTIWFGLISFDEAFGKRYCTNTELAQRLMAIEFPRFLKSAGFDPNKIVWYAGLHENTDNRHIHLSFYETEPSRLTPHKKGLHFSTGFIPRRHFDKFKLAVELRLTDISSQIAASRKELTGLARNVLFSRASKAWYFDGIQTKLQHLALQLPSSGSLAYDSENMRPFKPQIKAILHDIIRSNSKLYYGFEDYCSRAKNKDRETLEMLERNKIPKGTWPKYMLADKYLDDIYRRLGNQVIHALRNIKSREVKTKNRLANKRIRRRTILSVMEYAMKLNSEVEREAFDAFEEYLQRLKNENIILDGGALSEME